MKISKIIVLLSAFIFGSTTLTFAQSTNEQVEVENNTKTFTAKVKGITCSTDLKTISANVEKLKGVSTCKTGKAKATTVFEIAYNPALVTEKEIQAAIQNTGGCHNPNDRPYKVKQ
jgi:copper chaperone CopZ